jgi:hypothetical protein
MVARYVAVRDSDEHSDAHDVMNALDMVGIEYEYYGHNDEWSVIKMIGFNGVGNYQRTYESAVDWAGCDEE